MQLSFNDTVIIIIIIIIIIVMGIRVLISRPAHGPIIITGNCGPVDLSHHVHVGLSANVNC